MFRASAALVLAAASSFASFSFIGDMKTIKAHASAIPSNGDVNPYGLVMVPSSVRRHQAGHVLVNQAQMRARFRIITEGFGKRLLQMFGVSESRNDSGTLGGWTQ
jgi:hypothetical protein